MDEELTLHQFAKPLIYLFIQHPFPFMQLIKCWSNEKPKSHSSSHKQTVQ